MPPLKKNKSPHAAQPTDNKEPTGSSTADDALAADDSGLSGLEQFLSADAKLNTKGSSAECATSLPSKVDAPVDTDQERDAIQTLQSAYSRMIAVPPKKSRKSCFGHFHSNPRLVAIPDKPMDTISRTSGYSKDAVIYLMPEEWLLFVERGSLLITNNKVASEKPIVASYDSSK
ncbi:hypothetical protein IW150_005259 [Coemansia sp. RSA 2607]|nr:hypothetical protein IW150_005259 [Coemansia sp. RSA 2607]